MTLASFWSSRRLARAQLPIALLVGFLQRSPALKVAAGAFEEMIGSPSGALLRSAGLTVASLGAIHSLAGATTIVASTASPLSATVGQPIQTVAFGITGNSLTASSWQISSSVPAGLNFQGLTAPGFINTANPTLTGTPTAVGSFQIVLQAWEYPGETGPSSPLFSYTVNVAAAVVSFTLQPQSQTMAPGTTVAFNAIATAANGVSTPTYQWNFNGTPIAGATDHILLISSVGAANAGSYTCTATVSGGSATSSAATLALASGQTPGSLANISSRADVGTGGNILIGGFVLNGSTPRTLLIRAVGPGLNNTFGLTGYLAQPVLQLYQGSTLVYSNSGWGGDAAIASTFAGVGAFSLQANSADSVLLVTLPPVNGGYTAQVTGLNGTSGIALMEVYLVP